MQSAAFCQITMAVVIVKCLTLAEAYGQIASVQGTTGLETATASLIADRSGEIRRAWVNLGFGWPLGKFPPRAALNASLSYQFSANLVTARALVTADACFICDDFDEFWDIAVLYGRATCSGSALAALAAGLGVVGGHDLQAFNKIREEKRNAKSDC